MSAEGSTAEDGNGASPSTAVCSGRESETLAAEFRLVPTEKYRVEGKSEGCWNCGKTLTHGYVHDCGVGSCTVCPFCGAPCKVCGDTSLPPAWSELPPPPLEIADVQTKLAAGLLAINAKNVELTPGPVAVLEAHAFFMKEAEQYGFAETPGEHCADPIVEGFRADEPFIALGIAATGGFKSAFTLHIAESVASIRREPVLLIGFEEAARNRIKRLLARRAGLALRDVAFAGNQSLQIRKQIDLHSVKLAEDLATMHFVCGNRAVSPVEIAHLARQITDETEGDTLPLVIIDALQNVAPLTEERERRREIDAIMGGLEWIRDNVPARILLLSHAARGGEGKGTSGYNVALNGAKESSGIEYASDIVFLLKPTRIRDGQSPVLTRLDIEVPKHRACGIHEFVVAVEPEHGTFRRWEEKDADREATWKRMREAEKNAKRETRTKKPRKGRDT